MTGMEDRLSKIEASVGDQGTDPRIKRYLNVPLYYYGSSMRCNER